MSGSLAGKRILVTRSPEQAREVVDSFAALGAQVFILPAVSFSEPLDTASLDAAIAELATYDWVLLTSVNAANFFARRCRALLAGAALQGATPRFAAVGSATASAAAADGISVEFVAQEFRGLALAQELGGAVAGRKVLLPRSDRASEELPRALAAQGAKVIQVVAYRTGGMGVHEPRVAEMFRTADIDVVSIFSPSALANLQTEFGYGTLRRVAERAAFAAVGPVTADAIRDAGLRVAIVAQEATGASLVHAVSEYFASGSPAKVKPA
ncbi:MAG: uroporphyrinogen-III synthase [Candidatus Acidiferrales bacterium]